MADKFEIVPGNDELLNRIHRSRTLPKEFLDINLDSTHTGKETSSPKWPRGATRIRVLRSDDPTARLRFLPKDETITGQHSMPAIAGRVHDGHVPGLWLENATATAGGKIILEIDTLPPYMLPPLEEDNSAEEFTIDDTQAWVFNSTPPDPPQAFYRNSSNVSRRSGSGLLLSFIMSGYTQFLGGSLSIVFRKSGAPAPVADPDTNYQYASTSFSTFDQIAPPNLCQVYLYPGQGTPPAAGAQVNFISCPVPRDTVLRMACTMQTSFTMKITAQPLP